MKATHMPEPGLILLGGNLTFLDTGEAIPAGATYPDGTEIVTVEDPVESLASAFERQGKEGDVAIGLSPAEAPPEAAPVQQAPEAAPVQAAAAPLSAPTVQSAPAQSVAQDPEPSRGVPLAKIDIVQIAVPRPPIIQDPPFSPTPAPPPTAPVRPAVSAPSAPVPASQLAAAAATRAKATAPPPAAAVPPPEGFDWLAWPKGAAAPSLGGVPIVSGTMAEVVSPSDNNLRLGGILRYEVRTDRPELNPPGETQARLVWLAVGGVRRDLGAGVIMTAARDVLLGPKYAYRMVGKQQTFSVASQAVCGDGCLLVKNPDVGHYPCYLRSWDPMPGKWTRGALFFAFEGRARFVSDEDLAEGVELGNVPVIVDMSMVVALGGALPTPSTKIRELAQAHLIETQGFDPATSVTASRIERLRAAGFSAAEIAQMCPE